MLELDKIDFKKMGFRAGIEVHHQINSERKLFCNCKPELCDGVPDYRFERYFRPVLGEMGDFDEGMLIEYEKGYRVIYHAFEKAVCVYEQDEQPPFWPDYDSIYRGFELAHWLNFSALVDEVVVSRKQYLDGSITTGFQRTMVVARDGWIPINGKKHRISNLTVEEDSARKIRTENFGRTVYYNLDRLGMPLVEVITDHRDCDNPFDLQKLAEYIGLTLRLSLIGKRGLGTVRQDVNISITGGRRVEIKGVQDLRMFEEMSRREVVRQDMLLKITTELGKRKFRKEMLEHTYVDLTDKFPKEKIGNEYIVLGIRLPAFGGLLGEQIQPGKDFGQDIIEKAELISGIPRSNIFHSDELSKKAFRKMAEAELAQSDEKFEPNFFFPLVTTAVDNEIRKALGLKAKTDAYFIALGPQKWVIHAMKKIIERAKMALDGVPEETRKLLPNGNSEFLRVIHGKDRLYPDTDTPPLVMDTSKIKKLKQKVGKRPWEYVDEFNKKYQLSYEQTVKLIRHKRIESFLSLVEDQGFSPQRCYHFLEETLLAIRREGYATEKLSFDRIKEILQGAHNGLYAYNQIPRITKLLLKNPKKKLKQALSDLKIKSISDKQLVDLFEDAYKEYQEHTRAALEAKGLKTPEEPKQIASRLTGSIQRRINGALNGRKVFEFVLQQLGEKKQ